LALVTHKFKLDLTPGAARQVLYTSQGDIGRPFEADLYWNGSPWTATGTTASIRGKKPDDTVFDYTATVSGTAVTFETTEQMTIISGPVECELVFNDGVNDIASANFVLIVEASPYDPNAISESEVTGLVDLIGDQIGGAVDDWMETEAPTSPEFAAAMQNATDTYLDENGVTVSWDTVANKPDFDSYFENIVGVKDLLFGASWADNAYIDNSGVPHDLTGFNYTDFIQVETGETYSFVYRAGTTNNTIRIVGYDANGTFTSVLSAVSSTNDEQIHAIVFATTNTAQIRISISKVHTPMYVVKGVDFKSLQAQIDQLNREKMDSVGNFTIDFSEPDDGYIGAGGTIGATGGNWRHTKPFFVPKGSVITATVYGYVNAPIFWEYINGAYAPLLIAPASGVNTYTYTTAKDITAGVNFNVNYAYDGTVNGEYNIASELANIKDEIKLPYIAMFHKIAVLGDSLSSGEIYNGSAVKDCYTYSWLSNIARNIGSKFVHYSKGGLTSKAWWEDSGGYKTALADENEKATAYYIAFGTNDKNQSVYPIGTIDDVAGTDSFVGYMRAIIEYVHVQQENAIVFLVSTYNTSTASTPYNEMIESIAGLYDYCMFIDYANNGVIQTTQSNIYVENSHFSTLGYVYVANVIKELTEQVVNDNLEWFKHFGLDNYEV